MNQLFTAVNCSIGAKDWRQFVRECPHDRVELWWPWDSPTPSRAELDELHAVLDGRELVALNAWAGDMAARERGVLHRMAWQPTWVDAMAEIHQLTGVRKFNVLLGRGGAELMDAQRERFLGFADALWERFGGVALVEPLSGIPDYPIRDIDAALPLLTGPARLLLDVYHLAANDVPWSQVVVQIGQALPAHVQWADYPGRGAPGTGDLDFPQMLADLQAIGYDGELVLEHL